MKLLDLFYQIRNKLTAVKPLGVEVEVTDGNDKEPLRCLTYIFRCPKCGQDHCTSGNPYIGCSCGYYFTTKYPDNVKVIGLQDTINHLNVRINYMIATGVAQDEILPYIAEMKELSDALEYGTTLQRLEVQEWKDNPLGLKDSILYSLR